MDLSKFEISGEQDRIKELKFQSNRLIKIRWFYIGILITVAAALSMIAGLPTSVAKQYLAIGAIIFAINLVIYFANKLPAFGLKSTYFLIILQLIIDLAGATFVTYDQGGLDARTTVLFALPIVAAGLVFNNFIVYIVGFFSGISYIAALAADQIKNHESFNSEEALVPYIFYPVFFLLLARLVVYSISIRTVETREQAHDDFLALLTHQLRHPSSTAAAIIDSLENTPNMTPKKYKHFVAMLKTENQNLQHLLSNLLETSNDDKSINGDSIELPHLLQRLSHRVAEAHRRTGDLRLKLNDMSLTVNADSLKLSTALVNILTNAFQYTDDGTQVRVALRQAGADVIVIIEDHGKGISEEAKKNLFKKYSVDRSGGHGGIQGLGLGLYVAKKIIEAHNGSLHLISDKSGTRAIIRLKRGQK